jgi:hypothetical protein
MSVQKIRKTQQVIWLEQITLNNLHNLYIESGAYNYMALNEFIVKIITYFMNNENIVKDFLTNLYKLNPELKRYSFFIEKVEVEKPIIQKSFICPYCLNEFRNALLLREHLLNAHVKELKEVIK